MLFNDWYTDTVDIYRMVQAKTGNLTSDERQQIAAGVPCRVYSTQIRGANPQAAAAVNRREDKLACDIGTDIRIGDELIVTRGSLVGGTQKERYLAGDPQEFFDPVGVANTGLDHMEVGLLADNIARS